MPIITCSIDGSAQYINFVVDLQLLCMKGFIFVRHNLSIDWKENEDQASKMIKWWTRKNTEKICNSCTRDAYIHSVQFFLSVCVWLRACVCKWAFVIWVVVCSSSSSNEQTVIKIFTWFLFGCDHFSTATLAKIITHKKMRTETWEWAGERAKEKERNKVQQ